eukprot:CAMPEP_0185726918 /NCGR_PEP_ID=MMETSP1171-20130828/2755_1 /TAXON_ID=374046 /ORGANISM="Helicotheca tamensis, Strain CCMP826" /LENGTH=245 /DNA_ID=CAMNT_0028395367 /DNA_START=130 /DNA_END=867 /DNA_ORIENTATION=+
MERKEQHAPMNDSTLPPSQRQRVVAITTTTNSSKKKSNGDPHSKPLAARVNPRAKMGVKKGFGLHDWVRLVKHAKDPAQRKGKPIRPITKSELKLHNKEYDGWMALHGKVYNIMPYLHYHPGGVAILKGCLGKDGTALFEKYHGWVNIEGLIGPLLIGYLEEEKKSASDDEPSSPVLPTSLLQSTSSCSCSSSSSNNSSADEAATAALEFAVPAPRPRVNKQISDLLPPASSGEEEEDDLNPWEK